MRNSLLVLMMLAVILFRAQTNANDLTNLYAYKLDPKTCGQFAIYGRDPNVLPVFRYQKTYRPGNVLYVNVKVNRDCRIIETTPNTPYYYWVMGQKSKYGVAPCQGLDSDDWAAWTPVAPGAKWNTRDNYTRPRIETRQDGSGSRIQYTMGFMKSVVERYPLAMPEEEVSPIFILETSRNAEGKCISHNWAQFKIRGQENKMSIDSIFGRIYTGFWGTGLGADIASVILKGIDADGNPFQKDTQAN
jgi:hypothetical protein